MTWFVLAVALTAFVSLTRSIKRSRHLEDPDG